MSLSLPEPTEDTKQLRRRADRTDSYRLKKILERPDTSSPGEGAAHCPDGPSEKRGSVSSWKEAIYG